MTTITATLIDAEHVEAAGKTRKYKRPVYGLARALIQEGHDPGDSSSHPMEARHARLQAGAAPALCQMDGDRARRERSRSGTV